MWSQAVARTELNKLMATRDWSDIDGLWMQVGCYTANAMQLEAGQAPEDLLPCAGEGSNGGRIQMLPANAEVDGASSPYAPMGAARISYASPPYSGALALKLAVDKLDGADIPQHTTLPLPLVTNETVELCETGSWEEQEGGLQRLPAKSCVEPGLVRLNLLGRAATARVECRACGPARALIPHPDPAAGCRRTPSQHSRGRHVIRTRCRGLRPDQGLRADRGQ